MTHAAMAATGQPSHQDVPLARERAALYAWFATVYAEEMPEDRLAGWLGHGADPLLQALADGGMEREVQAVRHSLQAMAGEMGRGIEALGQGLRENDLIPSEECRRLESIGGALMNGASPLSLEPKEIRELGYTVCNLGIWMRDELRHALKIDQQQQ